MSWKEASAWGVALGAFFVVAATLGPEHGRELDRLLAVVIVVGIVAWRIWKGW
jgi:hypothetical protein